MLYTVQMCPQSIRRDYVFLEIVANAVFCYFSAFLDSVNLAYRKLELPQTT